MGKWGKLIVLAAAVAILLPVVIGVVYVVRFAGSGGELDKRIAEIKANGEPVSASELMDNTIPDDRNAAIIYASIVEEINKPGNEKDFDLLAEFVNSEKRMSTQPTEEQIRVILSRYSVHMQKARQAADIPGCRFKINWEDGFLTDTPHLTAMKRLALLARVEAKFDIKAGRTDEAAQSVLLQMKLAEALRDEPGFLSQARRFTMLGNACDVLESILDKGTITNATANALKERLERLELTESLAQAMKGERAIGISTYDQARLGKIGSNTDAGASNELQQFANNPIVRSALDRDELYYLNEMEKLLDLVRMPYRKVLQKKPERSDAPKYGFISMILLTMPEYVLQSRDTAATQVALARIALALHQHKRSFGSYPSSLRELRHTQDMKAPLDPYSGKSFIYKPRGNRYVLYSVGSDLKDNGGIERDASGPKAVDSKEESDIVWEVVR